MLYRAAFSLLEAMIALTILAVGTLAVLGNITSLNTGRQATEERQKVQAVVRSLTERLQSADWGTMRTDDLPWTLGRYESGGSTFPNDRTTPMTDTTSAAAPDCLLPMTSDGRKGLSILTEPSGLENLQVWLEYYRGSDFDRDRDGTIASDEAGLLDVRDDLNGDGEISKEEVEKSKNQRSNVRSFRFNELPTAYPDPEGTVLLRLIITWGIKGRHEAWVARRKS
jgi:hypothetical protein